MTEIDTILRIIAEAPEPRTVRQVADALEMDQRLCGKQVDRLRSYGHLVRSIESYPHRYRVTQSGLKRLGKAVSEPVGAPEDGGWPDERLTLVQKALRSQPDLQRAWGAQL